MSAGHMAVDFPALLDLGFTFLAIGLIGVAVCLVAIALKSEGW